MFGTLGFPGVWLELLRDGARESGERPAESTGTRAPLTAATRDPRRNDRQRSFFLIILPHQSSNFSFVTSSSH